jgi:hypothetical protein
MARSLRFRLPRDQGANRQAEWERGNQNTPRLRLTLNGVTVPNGPGNPRGHLLLADFILVNGRNDSGHPCLMKNSFDRMDIIWYIQHIVQHVVWAAAQDSGRVLSHA